MNRYKFLITRHNKFKIKYNNKIMNPIQINKIILLKWITQIKKILNYHYKNFIKKNNNKVKFNLIKKHIKYLIKEKINKFKMITNKYKIIKL